MSSAEEAYSLWQLLQPDLAKLERSLDSLLLSAGAHTPVPRGQRQQDRWTIYDDQNRPYLTRNYLSHKNRETWPGVFLHYFHRSDSDRELHNHPWDTAVAIILTGGYWEHRMEGIDGDVRSRYVEPFTVNVLHSHTYHRVDLGADHVWTLFIVGNRIAPETEHEAGWGFVDLETRQYEDARQRAKRLGQPW